MKIGELFVQLGVKADTFTVKDFVHAVSEIPFSVAAAVTSLTGMSFGFMELVKNSLDLSNNLSMFRAETGLSTEELQRWTGVAKQMGMSGDAVQQSVMGITNAMAQLRLGHMDQGFMLAMGQLGVNLNGKNAFQLLREIGEKTKNMDPNVASALLQSVHVNPEMMRIFQLSGGQFNRMAKSGVVMNEGDMRAMQDFQIALGKFELTIEKSFVPALTSIEPYMKDLAEVLSDVVELIGRGASGSLSVLHMLKDARRSGVGLFTGDGESYLAGQIKDRTLVYHGGEATYNIHGLTDPESMARKLTEEHMRRETMQHTMASKHFNNSGR